MGVFWVALSSLLGIFLTKAAGRVLGVLGLGICTFIGIAPLVSLFINNIISLFGSLPEIVVSVLAMVNIDKYLSIVFSAFSVKLLCGAAIRLVSR